jgi:dTDP-4-amino-4,6-dideoxygalactose transaminase
MRIPLVDLGAQQAEIDAEVRAGLDEVFAKTAFVGGPAVGRFEAAYAAAMDVAHVVGVANGTDALELALRAVGVTAGGEVILPTNTFIATAEAVSRIGAVPVLVDVDPVHLLIDPEAVRAALTPRTQAVVPVHLFGQVAPVEVLLKIAADAGVPLVEDAARRRVRRATGSTPGASGSRPARASTRARTSVQPVTPVRSRRTTPTWPGPFVCSRRTAAHTSTTTSSSA